MKIQRMNLSIAFTLLILILAASYLFISITSLKPDAAAAPIVICAVALILGGILLVKEWRDISAAEEVAATISESDKSSADEPEISWLRILSFTILYFIAFIIIGFYPATILFLLVCPVLINYRNWKAIIASLVFFMVLYWVGFELLIGVHFSNGLLFS